MIAILLVGTLILFVALGVPIAFSIVLAAASGILIGGVSNLGAIPMQMYGGVNSFTLMAIPMFALMGEIMGQTTLGTKLINIANELVGWMKGGLAMATVVVCMMFGTISGSAVAAAAALTGILVPEMEKRSYPKELSVSIMSSSSTLAIIIPPSSILILYGVSAGVSIADLYLASIIPGVFCGIFLMITAFIFAKKIAMAVAPYAKYGFEPHNPVTVLMLDGSGKLRDEVLNEKTLSAIVELEVDQTDVLPVFNALRDAQKDISTVFSVDLACRLEPDESCPAAIIAEEAGYKLSLNGKTNVGLGKPRYKED